MKPSKNDQLVTSDNPLPAWGPVERIEFRFIFVYFVLYIFPFPLYLIPGAQELIKLYSSLWNAIVPWVGSRLFHLTITVLPNGSGDTTFNSVQVLCYFVIAFHAAAIWTILLRKDELPRALPALRVCVRYSLATTMITYGAYKVIKSQFPSPSLDRLIQPFGDASPMGLLWTFIVRIGVTTGLTGAGEVLGGLLLLLAPRPSWRSRLFRVTSHVAMLNFSYDVPVKLFSYISWRWPYS